MLHRNFKDGTMPTCLPAVIAVALLLAFTAAQAADLVIDQRAQVFSEKDVAVAPGATLIFTNHDDVSHNISVFGDDGDADEDLGLQKPGAAIHYRFDKLGRFKIRCSIHPSMKMTVRVK